MNTLPFKPSELTSSSAEGTLELQLYTRLNEQDPRIQRLFRRVIARYNVKDATIQPNFETFDFENVLSELTPIEIFTNRPEIRADIEYGMELMGKELLTQVGTGDSWQVESGDRAPQEGGLHSLAPTRDEALSLAWDANHDQKIVHLPAGAQTSLTRFLREEVPVIYTGGENQFTNQTVEEIYSQLPQEYQFKFKLALSEPFMLREGLHYDDPKVFAEFVEKLKETGANTYRFSITWARVMNPDGSINQAGLQAYVEKAQYLMSQGIEPVIVMHHFDMLPGDDWTKPGVEERFKTFVDAVLDQMIPAGVTKVIPINEPFVNAFSGYSMGLWYPYQKNPVTAIKVIRKLARMAKLVHAKAHEVADRVGSDMEVISSFNISHWDDASDSLVAKATHLPISFLDREMRLRWFAGSYDSIGIQYYWSRSAAGSELAARAQAGKNAFADGDSADITLGQHNQILEPRKIYDVVMAAHKSQPGKPIYITEWGANMEASRVEERRWYMRETLAGLLEAVVDGANVKGSLMWQLISGYEILNLDGGGWDQPFGPGRRNPDTGEFEIPEETTGLYRDILNDAIGTLPVEKQSKAWLIVEEMRDRNPQQQQEP